MKEKKILVTGGAGYIGSYTNKLLHRKGWETVVLDNLSTGSEEAVKYGVFIEGDIGDRALLDDLFRAHRVEAVVHFAASIDVGESVREPSRYYRNNVCKTLTLLDAMREHGVETCIFSSTAAIFGIPEVQQVPESHPTSPINPYGESKLMVEKILQSYDKAYGLRSCSLRYFNAAGADPEGEIKNRKPKESNLIPVALRNLREGRETVIFGSDYPTKDGTCIRDYIHIHDLAEAHLLALEKILKDRKTCAYNLGNGTGYTVREVLNAAGSVTGKPLKVFEGDRREGDPPVLMADSKNARNELNWKPQFADIDAMIEHAWTALH